MIDFSFQLFSGSSSCFLLPFFFSDSVQIILVNLLELIFQNLLTLSTLLTLNEAVCHKIIFFFFLSRLIIGSLTIEAVVAKQGFAVISCAGVQGLVVVRD
jgi:hypothetical protein